MAWSMSGISDDEWEHADMKYKERRVDAMARANEQMARDEHDCISEMKANAMRMIEEMPDGTFEGWYTKAFVMMDEAATSGRGEEIPF